MQVFDCGDEAALAEAVGAAQSALTAGELVVMPTDTVYGLAADAFNPDAVQRLLDAKRRGREMPPPVLIGSAATLEALATDIQPWLRNLVGVFWPGPLTVVCREQPSLTWDLGDTYGTVAVRVPDHEVAIAVLKNTGPVAVSSANVSGHAPAQTADAARSMFGAAVSVYLEAGPVGSDIPSTILDATSTTPRVLRNGAISIEELHSFNNTIVPVKESDDRRLGGSA